MKRLQNKIIILTGGNGFLGSTLTKVIRDEGAICINFDVNHDTNLEKYTIKCDITDTGSVLKALELVVANFGEIDGLVNNAYPRTNDWGLKFDDIDFNSWCCNVNWQMNSYFFVTQQILKHMKINSYSSIINIGSIYGIVGPDFSVYDGTDMTMPAAYAAIKGGIINLTRYLASYLGPKKIKVNTISPGGLFDNQKTSFVENYIKKVPLRRMGSPSDIAPAVIFLLSNESDYITGQNIIIDGGWTAI
jgi:NAD(P)-dependent dehydrogenase (short-subunit alcohol dehydrogenase family)